MFLQKKTGCPGCKKQAIRQAQSGKTVSEITRSRIGEKARLRPGSLLGVTGSAHPCFKGGVGRDFKNPTTADYIWKNGIRKVFHRRCALTGARENLVCHHLYAYTAYPKLRYDLSNGVLVTREIHRKFHTQYGFGNNTEEQWIEFCKKDFGIDWVELKKTFFSSQN